MCEMPTRYTMQANPFYYLIENDQGQSDALLLKLHKLILTECLSLQHHLTLPLDIFRLNVLGASA